MRPSVRPSVRRGVSCVRPLERIGYRCSKPARCPRPSSKTVDIIHGVYLFHVFGFRRDADILCVTHLLRDIRIICRCGHSGGRVRKIRAFVIGFSRVVNNRRVTRRVILNECVIDAINIATRETQTYGGAISWCCWHSGVVWCGVVYRQRYIMTAK